MAFARSTQTVFYIMAAVMAATFIVALRGLPRGRLERGVEPVGATADKSPALAAGEAEPAGPAIQLAD
jgi:hypothetical protein